MKRKYASNFKIKLKFFLIPGFALFTLVILIKLISATIPYISDQMYKTAALSTGMVLPEGGLNILSKGPITLFGYNNSDGKSNSNPVSSQQPSSSTVSSQVSSAPPQSRPADAGVLVRRTYTAGKTDNFIPLANNAFIKNMTKLDRNKIIQESQKRPTFKISNDNSPQVLIMHTHATEAYEPDTKDYYDKSYNSRSKDNAKNVTRVGEEIANQLKAAGIGVIQDKTQHDNPSYNGSYERSEVTVKNYLKKYPSIKVVLDVHRDAIEQQDGTRIAPVASINGKNAAQLMIISGADDGTMNYPNYMENLKFSSRLQEQIEKDFPGLTRPLMFSYRKYNQHLTTGSILLEMGAHGNSFEEAIYAGELVGKAIGSLLNSLK